MLSICRSRTVSKIHWTLHPVVSSISLKIIKKDSQDMKSAQKMQQE